MAAHAVSGGAGNLIGQIMQPNFKCVDWKDVGSSAASGAIASGIGWGVGLRAAIGEVWSGAPARAAIEYGKHLGEASGIAFELGEEAGSLYLPSHAKHECGCDQ
jgi:hypothetical protein